MTTRHDPNAWMQPSTCSRRRAPVHDGARQAPRARPHAMPQRLPVQASAGTGFDCVGTLRLTAVALALAAGMAGCAQAPATNEVRVEPLYRLAHSDSAQVAGLPAPTVVRQGDVDNKPAGNAKRVERSVSQADLMARAWDGNAEALHVLGVQLAQQGQLTEGIAALRLANQKAPGQSRLLNNLGYALQLQGQTEQAQAMYEAALLADPSYDRARLNLVALTTPPAAPVVELALAAEPTAAGPTPPAAETAVAVAAPAVVDAAPPVGVARATVPAPVGAMAVPEAADVSPALAALAAREATEPAPSDGGAAFAKQMLAFIAVPEGPAMEQVPTAELQREDRVALAAPGTVASAAGMETPAPRSPQPRAALKGVQVEVFNGNGLIGAGGALRTWLRERGVDTARLGNAAPYTAQMTQVMYVEGQSALAREVSRRLPLSSELVEMPAGSLTAPVRVVLGHDLRSSSALAALASQPDAHPALKAAAKAGTPSERLPVPAATAAAQPLQNARDEALKVAAL